jgi:hypothetical protein
MSRPKLEVADIFRDHGAAWRAANAGHVSLDQLKVMTAIERCRTAALGGHVERCEKCSHTVIAYNSCRNRHCPKCQGAAAREWLAESEAELLPVPYYHVVFSLPAQIADIAYQNKAVIYDLLFKASSETMLTIAADPKHLGARIGFLSVLHSWGSPMTHHSHVHMIVPGGGFSLDGRRWVACRPRNLIQIVFDNKMYECSGSVPTATAHGTNLVTMANGAGIRSALNVNTLAAFTEAVQRAFAADGPHFIVAEISPSNEDVITYPRWLDDSDNRYRFMRYIEALEGRKLHEDAIAVKLSLNA